MHSFRGKKEGKRGAYPLTSVKGTGWAVSTGGEKGGGEKISIAWEKKGGKSNLPCLRHKENGLLIKKNALEKRGKNNGSPSGDRGKKKSLPNRVSRSEAPVREKKKRREGGPPWRKGKGGGDVNAQDVQRRGGVVQPF